MLLWFLLLHVAAGDLQKLLGNARCGHPIYCNQTYLVTFQLANIFTDSKKFVDSPSRQPMNQTITLLEQLLWRNTTAVAGDAQGATQGLNMTEIYDKLFYPPGYELYPVEETEENSGRRFSRVKGVMYEFARFLDRTWSLLTRKVNTTLLESGVASSIIPPPHSFIVPGGRFNEFYYWDTYWIVKGLLTGRRMKMVQNTLENFFEFIDKYGYIPNGNRVYYLNRSQPPLLTQMVRAVYEATMNLTLLEDALPRLETEYLFWMNNRSVLLDFDGEKLPLNLYNVSNEAPRPESFIEDLEIAKKLEDPVRFYKNVATGAETGWDFSSRWLRGSMDDLGNIHASVILPVDLNSMMYLNEMSMSFFYAALQFRNNAHPLRWDEFTQVPDGYMFPPNFSDLSNESKSKYFYAAALKRRKLMRKYFWSDKMKAYVDYDLERKEFAAKANEQYYLSSLFPLWANITDSLEEELQLLERIKDHLFKYPGGLPTSAIFTTQQWDFPNAWAPLQWIAVEALLNIKQNGQVHPKANELAAETIFKFIRTTFCGWNRTSLPTPEEYIQKLRKRAYTYSYLNQTSPEHDDGLYEKYNVSGIGLPGGGGEYVVQDGFGWTNGVVLDWLDRFSTNDNPLNYILPEFTCPAVQKTESITSTSANVALILVLIISVSFIFILRLKAKQNNRSMFEELRHVPTWFRKEKNYASLSDNDIYEDELDEFVGLPMHTLK